MDTYGRKELPNVTFEYRGYIFSDYKLLESDFFGVEITASCNKKPDGIILMLGKEWIGAKEEELIKIANQYFSINVRSDIRKQKKAV